MILSPLHSGILEDTSATKIGGRAAVFAAPRMVNWFHWLIQCLPRLIEIERSRTEWDFVHVPSLSAQHNETLSLAIDRLGIPESALVRCAENARVDGVFAPEWPWEPAYDFGSIPEWIVSFLRSLHPASPSDGPPVFISRRGFSRYNHESIEHILERVGFDVRYWDNSARATFKQDVEAVLAAPIVIGPYGSGLTNIVFARPGMHLIELEPNPDMDFVFKRCALGAGCTFERVAIPFSEAIPLAA